MKTLKTYNQLFEKDNSYLFNTFFTTDSWGHYKYAQKYIDDGGDVNITYDGNSLLSLALSDDYMDLATKLIDAGADVNFYNGNIPLTYYAVDYMNYNMLKKLFDAGAKYSTETVWVDDEDGDFSITTILNAITRIHTEDDWKIVDLLIENGAELGDTTETLNFLISLIGEEDFKQRIPNLEKRFDIEDFLMQRNFKKYKI